MENKQQISNDINFEFKSIAKLLQELEETKEALKKAENEGNKEQAEKLQRRLDCLLCARKYVLMVLEELLQGFIKLDKM